MSRQWARATLPAHITKEGTMAKVVTCPCGVTIRAETEDEFVRLVQEHGKNVHNQEVTREDALAGAKTE